MLKPRPLAAVSTPSARLSFAEDRGRAVGAVEQPLAHLDAVVDAVPDRGQALVVDRDAGLAECAFCAHSAVARPFSGTAGAAR
jgi:hypothetical protein